MRIGSRNLLIGAGTCTVTRSLALKSTGPLPLSPVYWSNENGGEKVDARRIGQLEEMFNDFGFQGRAARVRALTTYFHQSGYYRMGVTESLEERLANVPYYAEILMSTDLLPPDLGTEEIKRLIFESD